jgi:hypothetical protein
MRHIRQRESANLNHVIENAEQSPPSRSSHAQNVTTSSSVAFASGT